jgi:choline dehydrogenase
MASTDIFDYVIVGSGPGGAPVAARLTAAGYSVCVLEAGGTEEPVAYQVPAFNGLASEEPELRWDFYVRHHDDEEQSRRDRTYVPEHGGTLYPRSGTLGGCTGHHTLITLTPHEASWDELASMVGDPSWKGEAMRPYFERLEACSYISPPRPTPKIPLIGKILPRLPIVGGFFQNRSRHGYEGWLTTTLADPKLALGDKQLVNVILSAAKGTLEAGLRRKLTPVEDLQSFVDPNDWRVRNAREGLWLVPMSVRDGRRLGTRELLRRAQARDPGRLEIRTEALAARVLIDDAHRAYGVEYLEGRHLYRASPLAGDAPAAPVRSEVHARREVIVAAGAFNTPQLLKLSGIGPREELEQHGIDVIVELPGVGENLQDRYEVSLVSRMKKDFPVLRDASFRAPSPEFPADAAFEDWLGGRGLYATNGVLAGVIFRSSVESTQPDLFLFGFPGQFSGYRLGGARAAVQDKRHFAWVILKARTRNRAGSVTLRSADPRDVPHIAFRSFEEGAEPDLEAMADGVEFARGIMKRSGKYIDAEEAPGDAVRTRDDIKQYVRDQAWGHHASCSCAMGRADDPASVVDSAFRVRGVRDLRIVDASIFPRIPGFFIITSIYMASEKAADAILSDA